MNYILVIKDGKESLIKRNNGIDELEALIRIKKHPNGLIEKSKAKLELVESFVYDLAIQAREPFKRRAVIKELCSSLFDE